MIHNFFSKLKSDFEMILFKLGDNNGKKGEKLKRKDERKGKKLHRYLIDRTFLHNTCWT